MNILDAEDMIKGLPDQTLMQQAQMPTGELPQFLVISEIQRRSDMRKRHEAQMQEQSQGTVKDQIMREGIAAMMPQQPMGMPPQVMPQGMPPQGMPPQGMPTGMPPMGMAAGGVVQMQRGGFLDQYVAGAEAGPMPGGSTVRDQVDRLLASGMSYPEILSFVSKTFYGRPEVLEYVQSKVGRPQASMGDSMIPEAREALEREPYESKEARMPMLAGGSDIYKAPMVLRAADALGLFDSFKEKPEQERMAEPMASALVRDLEAQYATPDYMTTAPAAGGRLFDFDIDLGMPTREQGQAADRARIERIRSNLSPSLGSIDASDIDRSIAGMVSERAPRSGGFGGITSLFSGIADRIGELPEELGITGVDRDAKRRARIQGNLEERPIGGLSVTPDMTAAFDLADAQVDALDAADDARLVEMSRTGDASVQGGSKIQTQAKSNPPRDFSAMEDFFAEFDAGSQIMLPNKPGVESAAPVDQALAAAQQAQTDASDPANRLDISDILDESRRMTQANMLMQLGAGIAGGDLSKGISAAGAAGMKGAQEQRALDIRKRLAEYQAGRQDIAREEKSKQFYDQLAVVEKRYANELEKSARIGRNELFRTASALVDAAVGEAMIDGPARQTLVENLMNKYLNLYGPSFGVTDVPEVVGGMQTGAGSSDPLGIRGTP